VESPYGYLPFTQKITYVVVGIKTGLKGCVILKNKVLGFKTVKKGQF